MGDAFPSMADRRSDLVPEALPSRVRYLFSPGTVVDRLADRLGTALSTGDASVFGDVVMVQPGAWSVLKKRSSLGTADSGELRLIMPDEISTLTPETGLAGKFLRSREQVVLLAKELCAVLAEDGGFEIRAFTTSEMAKWWIYIGFDIEEPVFVVATKDGKYKFVVGFVDDHIFIVDELNALPD